MKIDHLDDGTKVILSDEKFETLYMTKEGDDKPTRYALVLTEEVEAAINGRVSLLSAWLKWCIDNCDDSPEYNFGTDATDKIRALLRGESVTKPDDA